MVRKCPECTDRALITRDIKGTHIDICRSCRGAFFDKEEFERVITKPKIKIAELPGNDEAT
ncbi:MAG: zf-TFIIB domain-containing protein, partial [Pseudomonadales bacterium]|nr:zf-TFIIB domain-containing protein [Pseudomonadales bacterium]